MVHAVGVLIVDEPYGLEPAFRAVLEHEPALHTVSEADLSRGGPDLPETIVALVVIGGAEGGVARIEDLRAQNPGIKIIAVFETMDAAAMSRLVAAGAEMFVAGTACARVVCAVILTLAGVSVAPQIVDPATADGLTPREAEILRFLSAGFSNKEVARRLNLSVRTVETHRLNLRRKTQTGRLKDLVALARQLGLAPVTESEGAASAPVRRTVGPAAGPFALPAGF